MKINISMEDVIYSFKEKLTSYTVSDLDFKTYIQDRKICRATKKNICSFKKEVIEGVMKLLSENYSKNEYFGIRYEYEIIENFKGVYIRTIETPLDEKSILLANKN